MSNFEKVSAATGPRTELHDKLHLTGAKLVLTIYLQEEVSHLFILIKRTKRSIISFPVLEKLLLMEKLLNLLLVIG